MNGSYHRHFKAIAETVAQAETKTSADIVVAVEPWSGNYRDIDLAIGAVIAIVSLAVLLYSPVSHPEWAVLVDVIAFFLVGTWVSHSIPGVRRLVTPKGRQITQVADAAAAMFCKADVWTTHARTGLLIYVSLLEREIVVLEDKGVAAAVDAEIWQQQKAALHGLAARPDALASLPEGIQQLGELLGQALPAPKNNIHELPNRIWE